MQEFIGIDLGSNSLRGIRMNTHYEVLGEYEAVVRSAEGLSESGKICNAALERIILGLQNLKKALKIKPQDKIIALTTQAMRQATNSQEVLEIIAQKTQITFQIIKGEEEAYITSLAPQRSIKKLAQINPKYQKDCFVIVDMGGASSEFIFCAQNGITAKSFEIGIVQSKDKYKTLENFISHKDKITAPIIEFINKQHNKPKFLVANSGTPTMVCALKMGLKSYDSKKVFGKVLKVEDFKEELRKFETLSNEEKENLVGILKADVVPFGIMLFLFFMEILGFKECLIIDEGVREGAAILGIDKIDLRQKFQ
ncbi:phosphatase [Helicobacter sp. 14348-15]|uniref:Phosphatase n=1 Tax=Helicobacter colisuis TaxID=2949739 RepID=A0ABT0TX55_9HELI|nr:phosphatase [Helicobacter colisuis]MCL9820032.1 phosphatase [Helicobacter colisuis]MCL9820790.1 phosphatase [Helicobacter colisuis]